MTKHLTLCCACAHRVIIIIIHHCVFVYTECLLVYTMHCCLQQEASSQHQPAHQGGAETRARGNAQEC